MIRSLFFTVIAAAAFGQQPAIENAKVETRAFSGSLATVLTQLDAGPFWAGYSEPAIPGNHFSGNYGDMCCDDHGCRGYADGTPVWLEGQTAVVVLVRMESGRVDRLRVASPDCKLDGGGLPFYWINGVPADASVAWLKSQVKAQQMNQAILAISLHAGAAVDRAMDDLTSPNQPELVRGQTAFWLGTSRGAKGFEVLKRMLAGEQSDHVRGQIVFGMSLSKEPDALKTMIDTARNDKSPYVRQQALFWLAQKAGNRQAAEAIGDAVSNDADRSVKEHAVFALTQLPHDQGILLLINVAKTNADPAVRKKALFWLGQSNDSRALDFIAQILKQ